ncbi:hypothetical protein BCR34DRAFT_564185 [Clohesyomyces aquaticus]|uniref:Rhodopsin domain-containing protein n=1 Tax=Clohesyomyces aquaticus TaxID=1231657 RepID=A0A1Y1ZPA4_9PLEO|nr:hypothetical protein BCR34DRAFT_564185 [Clohesyomyces aquaticus]
MDANRLSGIHACTAFRLIYRFVFESTSFSTSLTYCTLLRRQFRSYDMNVPTELPANANETQTVSARAVNGACCALVATTVLLRYLGRWSLQRRVAIGKGKGQQIFGLDDLFNILAVLTFYGLSIAVFTAIDRGMGVHAEVVLFKRGLEGLSEYNQAIFVCALFYNTTLGMIKLSVLSLYHRILRGVQSQVLRTVVWAVFGIVAVNTLANVLVSVFQCWPVKAAWDVTILPADKKCIDINAFYLGNAITGVITDTTVYLLSVPIVKPLQMDGKTKLQLLATMLIGGFAVVTSIVRLGFLPALLKDADFTMAMAVPMDWSVAEPAVGILVSSMPAIRAVRYLWRDPNHDSYGSNANHSTLKSRNDGHIQLYDVKSVGNTKSDTDSGVDRGRAGENDSEENLVLGNFGYNGMRAINKTTELQVSYGPR